MITIPESQLFHLVSGVTVLVQSTLQACLKAKHISVLLKGYLKKALVV